jgi:hypothetical protein
VIFLFVIGIPTLPCDKISVGQQNSIRITLYGQNPIFGEELANCWDELFGLQVIEDQRFKYVQFVAFPPKSSLTPVIHEIEKWDN